MWRAISSRIASSLETGRRNVTACSGPRTRRPRARRPRSAAAVRRGPIIIMGAQSARTALACTLHERPIGSLWRNPPVTGQSWDPDLYARSARFVSDLGMPVVALLDPRPGERILDLGCGDGVLTEKLAALGCEVVGADASPAQVEAARARGLDARVLDGEALPFEAEFDAVFSNAALHWMKKPGAVVEGVRRALRQGGRFVAECGGRGNVRRIEAALAEALGRPRRDAEALNSWYFPSPHEYRRLLEAHGFEVKEMKLFPPPTPP